MIVRTTAGELTITQADSDADSAIVIGDTDALQALRDGVEMSGGGGTLEPSANVLVCTKEQLAIWIQFEILNYLTYTEIPDELYRTS